METFGLSTPTSSSNSKAFLESLQDEARDTPGPIPIWANPA